MEIEIKNTTKAAESAMKKAVEHFEQELAKIRAGKASPIILEGLRVDYYGSATPVSQVANISVADARTLTIQPYEKNLIPAIEKSIRDSNLGLSPQNDGILIRVTLPILTEERRKQLVKQAKEAAEEGRVAIRNLRRDYNEALKKMGKQGASEDLIKGGEADIQKHTNNFIEQVDKLLKQKEAEIMTV